MARPKSADLRRSQLRCVTDFTSLVARDIIAIDSKDFKAWAAIVGIVARASGCPVSFAKLLVMWSIATYLRCFARRQPVLLEKICACGSVLVCRWHVSGKGSAVNSGFLLSWTRIVGARVRETRLVFVGTPGMPCGIVFVYKAFFIAGIVFGTAWNVLNGHIADDLGEHGDWKFFVAASLHVLGTWAGNSRIHTSMLCIIATILGLLGSSSIFA